MSNRITQVLINFLKKNYLFVIGLGLMTFHLYKIIEFSSFIYHETDARWWLPLIEEKTSGLSWHKVLEFVFTPTAWGYPHVYVKLQPFLISKFIGYTSTDFIIVSLFFHMLTSLFLFYLCRQLKFDLVTSLISGVLHFSYFNHFHAYIYSIAFQHVLVAFFIISILYFYLKTNEIYANGGRYKHIYIFTLFLILISSFSRAPILIVPILIFFDIFMKYNKNERIKYYNLWLGSFFIYLLYQSFFLSYMGDDKLADIGLMYFTKLEFPFGFILLFSIGSALLFCGNIFIRISGKRRKLLIYMMFIGIALLMILTTRFYYFFVPFINFIQGFFIPINMEMASNSGVLYHKIKSDINVFFVLLTFFIIIKYYLLNRRDIRKIFFCLISLKLILDSLFIYHHSSLL